MAEDIPSIYKSEKTIGESGVEIHNKEVSVKGTNLEEVKKIFKEVWENE